ncbi:MAG: choice-of-anchor A family protein [Clostridia bacterium]|nr:choice-of-anchor A family protein [Clostridia bacterium]
MGRRKSEYVDFKRILRPGTVILVLLVMVLSFVAVKLVADSTAIRDGGDAIKGDSILGEGVSYKENEVSTEFENVEELSSMLSKLEATHTEWTDIKEKPEENGFFCIGTSAEDLRLVYRLEQGNLCNGGYSFSDFKYFWVDSVNTSFYALINIPGEVVDLSDYYILVHDDTGNLASRLVINCYEAKVVKIKNTIVTGTIMAPYANIECDRNTSVNGQIFAKGIVGSFGYYREIPYGGYKEIFTVAKKVEISNNFVRMAAFNWLKENYPDIYENYPDDYVLNTIDVSRVTELILDDALVMDYSPDLKLFENLKKLSFRRTRFTSMDVSYIPGLVELDISDSLVSTVVLPSGLSVLTADNSALTELDVSLLPSLTKLSLSGVTLTVPLDYTKMGTVKDLNLSNTGFVEFTPEETAALVNLITLDISDNPDLVAFSIKDYKRLQNLNIGDCGLTELSLEGAENLKTLSCSYNDINVLDITPAKNLTRCEAYGDAFKKIIATGMSTYVGCFENVPVEK